MNDYLLEMQYLLKAGNYAELLECLKTWGEDAPSQLWGVVAWLALQEDQCDDFISWGDN